MKKLLFSLMIFAIILGCLAGGSPKDKTTAFNPDFVLGVIESTEQKNLSYITYYDE